MVFKNLLLEVLNKLGKTYEELSPQAKATFDRWEKVFTAKSLDIETLKEFLKGENENLLTQMLDRSLKPNSELDIRLKAELSYGRLIVALLESPEGAAKNLERYLRRQFSIK